MALEKKRIGEGTKKMGNDERRIGGKGGEEGRRERGREEAKGRVYMGSASLKGKERK